MPEREQQHDRTTQTDLLYGLALEERTNVATLPPCATTDFESTNHSAEISLSEFNGPRDRIVELAATRADSGLHALHRHVDEHGKKPARAPRWRYADGIAPRPATTTVLPAVHVEVETDEPTRSLRQTWRRWRLPGCGWLASFLLHLILIPLFALVGVATVARTWQAAVVGSHIESREVLDIAAPHALAPHPSAVEFVATEALSDAPLAAIEWEPTPAQFQAVLPIVMASDDFSGPVDDIHRHFQHPGDLNRQAGGADDNGAAGSSDGTGEAKFFGAQAAGQKFVFVVDCSTSMAERDRWQHACQELDESIHRLTPDQLFYVILFDGLVHRMFNHDEREAALYPATEENKQRVRAWLQTARLGPETRPFLAMRCAMELRPDVIFMLSDGDFNDPTASYLKEVNRKPEAKRKSQPLTVIHTINFHNRSLSGTAMLKRIARENGGKYTFVSPD